MRFVGTTGDGPGTLEIAIDGGPGKRRLCVDGSIDLSLDPD